MKNFKQVLTFVFLFILNITIYAQAEPVDTALLPVNRSKCGFDPSTIVNPQLRLAGPSPGVSPTAMAKASYPASAIFNCGKFDLYYEDVALSTGMGFNAGGGVGAMRRNTLCQVYQYIQTIFDFSNIPAGDHITIEIQQTPPFASGTFLASAGPVFPGSALQGVYNGSVLNHYLPPYSSPVPTLFDGTLVVSFNSYTFYNDIPLPPANCSYDLFSVCLHEVGHQLGFLSLLREDAGFNPESAFGNNQYTLFDWQNIWHGDISNPLTFEKIVTGTSIVTPEINPLIVSPTNYLRDEQLWLNNNGRFLNNLPIYSGIIVPGITFIAAGSLASHMDGEYLSFNERFSLSPGFMKKHSMGLYFDKGEVRRGFSEQEIRIFLQLGYTLDPVYAGSTSINGIDPNATIINTNRPPYTTKQVTSISYTSSSPVPFPDLIQTPDFVIPNNGIPFNIDLSLDGTLNDLDGDAIGVEDNTLYNIRGCGNGGNNHDQLVVVGNTIVYTPRANFIGRAQFGFYLTDGKERGSFMVYTIDVTNGLGFVNTPNSNTPAGVTELIINGDYEEGTETRRNNTVLEESIHNTTTDFSREEGLFFMGDLLGDAHPLQYVNWTWSNGNGIIVGNSQKTCTQPTTPGIFGSSAFSFPNPPYNNPIPTAGNRYSFIFKSHNYNTISVPLQKCYRYIATFDVNFANTGLPVGSTYNFNLHINDILAYPTNIPTQIIPVAITVGAGWQTVSVPFNYCSATAGNYLNFVSTSPKHVYYDNVSLTEDPIVPPALTVTLTNSLPTYCAGSGSSSTLGSIVANGFCNVTYSWAPGGATTASITVSPSTTTTYTLTVNDGCTIVNSNTTVTVTPMPIATFSYSGTPYCQIDTDPSPSGTYSGGGTFTSTAGLSINSTSGLVDLLASTPGAYTVTYTIPASGGCPAVVANSTITITPLPVATFSYSGTPYCQIDADPSPIYSGGGTAGTFASSVGLSINSVDGIVDLSASTPGTYSVTNTFPASGGCPAVIATSTITITALPIATFSYSGTPYCQDPTINPFPTFSGGGSAGTFTASPSGLTINSGTGQITTSTSTLGVYTVTNAFPASGGCPAVFATTTITINSCVTPCPGCILLLDAATPGLLTTSPTQYKQYCLNNNLTISGTINIALSEVRIAPTVTITVLSGSTLNIYGSHLYACNDMWEGIVVQAGGSVNVISYSAFVAGTGLVTRSPLIEDAKVAIDVLGSSPLTTNILNVNTATFNRNQISIRIASYGQPLVNYPFTIVNSVFTSRTLVSSGLIWPQTSAVKATYAVANPLIAPYINPAVFPNATLKPPFAGQWPTYGIALNTVGQTIIAFVPSPPPPTYYEIKIGATGTPANRKINVFDNQVTAIESFQSNLTCVNNVFQNAKSNSTFGITGRIGINATVKQGNYRLQVTEGTPIGPFLFNNKFFDCARAINVSNYLEVVATNCDIRSNTNSYYSPSSIPFNHLGQNGVIINTNRYRVMNISKNTIYNIANGITFTGGVGSYFVGIYGGVGQYSGQITINENTIQPDITLPLPVGSTRFVRNAIRVSNTTGITDAVPSTNITVNNNTAINAVFNGIECVAWQSKNVITNGNTITLRDDPSYVSMTITQYGIAHKSNLALTSYGNSIRANSVTGTGITFNPDMVGITTSLCQNQVVQCNATHNIYLGIKFDGNNVPTAFNNNNFDNTLTSRHKYAYVLDNNGVIGQQGTGPGTFSTFANPSDNLWNGTWVSGTHYKTLSRNASDAILSKLWVRGVGAFNPSGVGYNLGISAANDYNASGAINITNPFFTVPYVGCAIPAGGGSGGTPGFAVADIKQFLEDIAQDNIPFAINADQTKIINKNQLYRLLKTDGTLLTGSTILQDFYNQSTLTYREDFIQIEQDMVANDFVAAESKISGLSPASDIENNYKQFYSTYTKFNTDSLSNGDSTQLYAIANGCPFIDGVIVYQARTLYNSIYSTSKNFEDNCVNIESRAMLNKPFENKLNAHIFPNPTTGELNISLSDNELGKVQVRIYDMVGKIAYEESCVLSNGTTAINLNLNNGVYFIEVVTPEKEKIINEKLIINR